MTDTLTDRASVTVFTTSWCGPCARLKRRLSERGISFVEVDVETDDDAAALLASINGGNLTVPTVRFADGSSITNPGVEAVSERLIRLALPGESPAG